ncbi:MAG: beta-mannosidase [Clostridia bacterium]|nr:beta-mannosidase [Clostridia bacterium]
MKIRKTWAAAVFIFGLLFSAPGKADLSVHYEAENGEWSDKNEIVMDADASNGRAVGSFSTEDAYAAFEITVPSDGFFDLAFRIKKIGGAMKVNNVYVDGVEAGTITCESGQYDVSVLRNTRLTAGVHRISVQKDWGYILLDSMTVTETAGISESVYNVQPQLINPRANQETQALYRSLCAYFGRCILSGQQCDDGIDSREFQIIHALTGKYPAVMGLDMRDYTASRIIAGMNPKAVEHAIAFHEMGGIVTFCWHWCAPPNTIYDGMDENGNPRWWASFYTKNTSFDIGRVLHGLDPPGKQLVDEDIRTIAAKLKELEEHHVPVLWRPLHEGSGGWFWWGANGPEVYKELWIYLYDQLTNVYNCNNLIWVWNGQHPDWYPGDAYVDIIGEDIYFAPHQYSAYAADFAELTEYAGKPKIIALSEIAVLPDVDACIASKASWAWFCTWKGEYIVREDGTYSDAYTDLDTLKKVYFSDYVFTLEDL